MARFGRRFPIPANAQVAALLQVPIAGVAALTLPHPLVMVARGSVGINATAALTLPHPLVMQASGAVGAGAVAGTAALTLPHPLVMQATGTVGGVIVQPTGLWSSSDLLQRAKFYAQRPTLDATMADSDWYSLLTEAQSHWQRVITSQVPQSQYLGPVQLQSQDGGFTYYFGTDPDGNQINPMHAELTQSPTGRPWFAGAHFDQSGDFVWEGDHIRFYGQRARPMTNGPWAVYVQPSGTLNANTQPVLKPPAARILIAIRATILWATRGGYRNPAPFEKIEQKLWSGDPANLGDTGILGALKLAYWTYGSESVYGAGAQGAWWTSIPSGLGYQGTAP